MTDIVPGRRPESAAAHLLYEGYRTSHARNGALRGFYAVKPLIPRRMQIRLRRLAARRQQHVAFPAWPIEPALVRHRARVLEDELTAQGVDDLPFVNVWPARERFAYVLTHDVESRAGMQRIPDVLEIERQFGLVSSWNFCTDWYRVDPEDLEVIRRADCEIGVHGVRHDGRLFESRETLRRNLPAIRQAMEDWGAVGFRSPAMRREAAWMHELPCLYDSSFPDTDPFQPQPGGCCSIHPFFMGDVVELPVTLAQDFMLFDLLGARDIGLWSTKASWIMRNHGLINVIVHPDYLTPQRLGHYEALLTLLVAAGGWHALPREVASWWRTRDGLRCVVGPDGEPHVEGPGSERAGIVRARVEGEEIAYAL